MPKKPTTPPSQLVDLHFPLAGIDLSGSYDRQPNRPTQTGYARTTVEAKNVRGYIPLNDRAVGGSRAGLIKRVPAQVSGNHVIQELALIVGTAFASPITPPATGTGLILLQGPTTGKAKLVDSAGTVVVTTGTLGSTPVAYAFDADGNAYIAGGSNASPSILTVVKYSTGGVLVWTATASLTNGQTTPLSVGITSSGQVETLVKNGNSSMQMVELTKNGVVTTPDKYMLTQLGLTPTATHVPSMSINGDIITISPAGSGPAGGPSLYQMGPSIAGGRRMVNIPGVNGGAVSAWRSVGGRAGSTYVNVIDTTNNGTSKPSGVVKIDSSGAVVWTDGFLYDNANALNWYNSSAGVDYPYELAYNDPFDLLAIAGQYEAGPSASYNLITANGTTGAIVSSALLDAGSVANDVQYRADLTNPETSGFLYGSVTTVRLLSATLTANSTFATLVSPVPLAASPRFD